MTSLLANWGRLFVIAIGTMVVPLDSSVNVAFPSITSSFDVPQSSIQWVIVCYVIVYATLLLIFGRLGDLFGHFRIFQCGLGICSIAFLGSGLALEFEHLLITRLLQGIGAAMVLSCGPALTTSLFGAHQRTLALGFFAGVMGAGAALGPTLGGVLVDMWGWSSVFWFRLPIALIALVFSFFFYMPAQPRAGGNFDYAGASWLIAGIGVFLLAVSRLRHDDISALEILVYFAIVGLSAVMLLFGRRHRREQDAVVSLSIFRNRDLVLVTVTGIGVNFVAFAMMLFVPYYLNLIAKLSFSIAGIVLASSPIGIVAAGQIAPYLVRRFGAKPIALSGGLLTAIGTGLIGIWGNSELITFMIATAFLHGLGLGLYQVAQLDISIASLPHQNRGIAGSLVMMTRTLGVVLAASLLTSLFVTFEGSSSAASTSEHFLAAFQITFQLSAACLAAFLVASCAVPQGWFFKSARE